MNRYVIADIHGGAKTFQALLDKIALRREDCLYLLGDYVDRGPDSRGVLDIIMQLLDLGYDVRPIRGNHEDLLLRRFTGQHDEISPVWLEIWGGITLKSFGVDSISKVRTRYITFLDALPYYREDDKFYFVHAGLDLRKEDPLTQTTQRQLLWGEVVFPKKKTHGDKIVVSGHKIRSVSQIRKSLATPHIQIDNGAYYQEEPPHTGNLVALNLDTLELVLQEWLDGEALG